MESPPHVYVIDDDPSVRRATARLVRSFGLSTETFASAADFLHTLTRKTTGVVICDVRMPRRGGLELQERLECCRARLPMIFMTGDDDVEARDQAMRAGAVRFLLKPIQDSALHDAILTAFEHLRQS